MVQESSAFFKFWTLGYRNLVPIVPPGAQPSPKSSLYKRPAAIGKAVGVKGDDGLWRGYDWLNARPPTEADLTRWAAMGAGVGIRTGDGLVALDIDTLDEKLAAQIDDAAVEYLSGDTPCRVGRWPKRLYLFRAPPDTPYHRVEFTGHNGQTERVELLCDQRQFVAHGIHATTGKAYSWDPHPIGYDQLPQITAEQFASFFQHLARILPAATIAAVENAERKDVKQHTLTGDAGLVRRAVEALSNTAALYPTYDDYIRVGAAIKGAMQDDPAAGLDLYQQWAARYDGGENDPEIVEADWRRIKPPFEIGARWLYDMADRHSNGAFRITDAFFDEIQEQTNPFAQVLDKEAAAAPPEPPFPTIRPLQWEGYEPPEREWEVEGWIPKGEVTLLYGDGGIGKTLLIHQYATAAAAGLDWLGQPTRKARVLCFFCEDSEAELHRRQKDICKSLLTTLADIDENLLIAPRKFLDNIFALHDRNNGAMRVQAVYHQLRKAALAFKADVVIVDTIADIFGGSEIDRSQVNQFVKTCLGKLAQDINGSVIALGHPSVAGKQSGSGTSGSTAWSNAVRSRLYLRYPKGVEKGDIREIEGMKLNYGPKGNLLKLQWKRGAFDVIAGSVAILENGAAGHIPDIDEVVSDMIVGLLPLYESRPLSLNAKAGHYAPRVFIAEQQHVFAGYTEDNILSAMRALERQKRITPVTLNGKAKRPVYGYAVTPATDTGAAETGLFE